MLEGIIATLNSCLLNYIIFTNINYFENMYALATCLNIHLIIHYKREYNDSVDIAKLMSKLLLVRNIVKIKITRLVSNHIL